MDELRKEVWVKLTDRQNANGEQECIELTSRGVYTLLPDGCYSVEFKENFDEDAECTTTLTLLNKQCVLMVREGLYNSELTIEQDVRHSCHYATPYGSFMIGIFATNVSSDIKDGNGTLKMEYTIDFYSGLAAENEITVEIRSTEKN